MLTFRTLPCAPVDARQYFVLRCRIMISHQSPAPFNAADAEANGWSTRANMSPATLSLVSLDTRKMGLPNWLLPSCARTSAYFAARTAAEPASGSAAYPG